MKIRAGFVSNSSSSSFLAVVKKDDYDKALKNLGPLSQAVCEYANITSSKFAGEDCILHYHTTGEYSTFDNAHVDKVRDRAMEIAREQKTSLSSECYEEGHWEDFICESMNEIVEEFEKKMVELEKDGKAITHGDYI